VIVWIKLGDMSLQDIENAIVPTNAEMIAEKYSNKMWLRTLVAGVPYIGGGLDIQIAHEAEKFRARRINVVLNATSRAIERLGKEKLDNTFLASEEWFDLVISSLEKAVKVREEKRLKAVGRVLAYSAIGSKELTIHPVDLISILTELSDQEAQVLGIVGFIYNERHDLLTGSVTSLFTTDGIKVLIPPQLHPSLELLCSRLVGKGLFDTIAEYFSLNSAGKEIVKIYSME